MKTHHARIALIIAAVTTLAACDPAAVSSPRVLELAATTPTSVVRAHNPLEVYLLRMVCPAFRARNWPAAPAGAQSAGCLRPVDFYITRSNGRRIRLTTMWFNKGSGFSHQYPHMARGYVDALLATAKLDRRYFTDYRTVLGIERLAGLVEQVQYMLQPRYAVDTPRVLAFKNAKGLSDAMHQAQYALLFNEISEELSRAGFDALASRFADYSHRFVNSFDVVAATDSGGVRSTMTSRCGPNRNTWVTCAFYHSRGGTDVDVPGTAINQMLASLRDLARLRDHLSHHFLRTAQASTAEGQRDRLRRMIESGYAHLAYAPAHDAARGNPPNFADFAWRSDSGQPYYFAYYEFDIRAHAGVFFSRNNNCNYHRLNLNLIRQGHTYLRRDSTGLQFALAALDAIIQPRGSNQPLETIGQSATRMPLYQYFESLRRPELAGSQFGCPDQFLIDTGTYPDNDAEDRSLLEFYRQKWSL